MMFSVQIQERGIEGDAHFGYQSILPARRSTVSTECHVQQAGKQTGGRSVASLRHKQSNVIAV